MWTGYLFLTELRAEGNGAIMIISRVIYIILVIASLVFATAYGGYIPELIRDALIIMPVVLIGYISIIYIRIIVKQKAGDKTILKGYPLDYNLVITNKDLIPYLGLKVIFHDKVADIVLNDNVNDISLLPKQQVSCDGRIICKYAGTYNIGIDRIDIKDFFNIFHVRYKIRKQIKVHVRPQEIDIASIKSCICSGVSRNPYGHYIIGKEISGSSVRNYIPGDNIKRIHWKNSAKLHKLVTRQNEEVFEESTAMIIDTALSGIGYINRVITVDKILHTAVAIALSFLRSNLKMEIVYNQRETMIKHPVDSNAAYKDFYEGCENISFIEAKKLSDVISEVRVMNKGYARNVVIIAGNAGKEVFEEGNNCAAAGYNVTIINVTAKGNEQSCYSGPCNIINMNIDDDICEVLSE